jgi:hypothetical protein
MTATSCTTAARAGTVRRRPLKSANDGVKP